MLRLSTRYLHEQLDLVEAQHAHDPGWVSHAAAGHMRYWLNEPDAAALLHQAAQQYHGQAHHHAEELLHIGYLAYLERGWEGAWEPETLDELIVTPLPEQQQEVIELHPDRLVIHFVYDH